MAGREEIVASLAQFALFADFITPQLESAVEQFQEVFFADGTRILRQGLTGSGFYIVLDGECSILVDGEERARLGRGEFFGEVSVLLGDPPVADVVARGPMRCLVIGSKDIQPFLLANPKFMYRMLQAQARRLRNANRWRS